jgi:hypothetical protein
MTCMLADRQSGRLSSSGSLIVGTVLITAKVIARVHD